MRQIMIRFIKTSVQDSTNIIDIDLQNKSNFKDLKDIDIEFSTRKVLNKVMKPVEEMRFRKECCEALVILCQLLLEKSPFWYKWTKGILCFDLSVALNPKIRNPRLDTAL